MSEELVVETPRVPPMSPTAIDKVRKMEGLARQLKQVPFVTHHLLHAGMYARTVTIPAGTLITGALVKAATILVVTGDALVYVGADEPLRVSGCVVLPASAGRKQAFVAETDVTITMIAPCDADTVAEAQALLTDEIELLPSLDDPERHRIVRTGE